MPRPAQILLIATATLLASAAADAAEIVLRQRLAPTGPVIRLGQIAEILRTTPEETARLAALPLMPAPAPGTVQVVRAQEIRDLMVAHGVDLGDLRFDGAIRVTIGSELPAAPPAEPIPATIAEKPAAAPTAPQTGSRPPRRRQSGFRVVSQSPARSRRARVSASPASRRTAKTELLEAIQDYVLSETGDEYLRVDDLDLLTRNANYLSNATTPPSVRSTDAIGPGRQRFLIAFESSAGPVNFPVFAEVWRATPVVVAAAPIARGATITAANARVVPRSREDTLPAGESPFLRVDEVIGAEAGRAIRPGQMLTDATCLPPTLVRRGEVVDVVTGGGGVRVSMKARSRSDGRKGETIEVENLTDRQRLLARVVGRRELAVLSGVGAATNYLSGVQSPRRTR